ncbi:MAG: alpha/beta hydrolase family protein, partial [Rhodothermales bacterium]
LPKGEGLHPVAIFIHGSGNMGRKYKGFRVHAQRLARLGLAMLIYDKRGVGESTGDWRTATFSDLAEDALGAVELLKEHQQIDPSRIGLFGLSQGGWIDLLVASRADIAFIVMLSGAPMTPAEQGHYIVEARLRKKGYTEEEIAKALELDRQITEVYRTDSGWEEAQAAIEVARNESWFEDARLGLQSRDSWNWQWYRDVPFDFDPIPILEALEIPIFAAHGEEDMLVPGRKSAEIMESIKQEGNKDITNLLVPEVGHGVFIKRAVWPDMYWDALEAWLRDKVLVEQ